MLILNLFSAGRKRETVPIFPLQTVLFPGGMLPLRIFEARYMDMAKACLDAFLSTPFGGGRHGPRVDKLSHPLA